jgi:hypothetical protein
MGEAMGKRTIIVFAVATGIVAVALAGAARHRGAVVHGAIQRNLGSTTPAANGAADSAKAEPAATAAATDGSAPAADATAAAPASAAPAVVVPAGTTVTVRLGEKLGSKISKAGQSFSATLDQDVVVDGKTVLAAGASVNGEVAFVRSGGAMLAEPNVQLKLTSVNVNNADLALVTSTRSFGPTAKGKKKVGHFFKSLFRHGKEGCQFTSNSELCENVLRKAGGKEKEVLLAEQSSYSFTLKQPLQIQ